MTRSMHTAIVFGVLAAILLTSAVRSAHAHTYAVPLQVSQLTSEQQIDAYLAKVQFHGYILLLRHGRTILSKGYGMADVARKSRNTIHTRWPMFGIENFMVAIAILRLQEQKKLSVQDRVCRYITGCQPSWKRMTIHHLLTGTSGIAGYDLPYFRPKSITGNSSDITRVCQANSLVGPVGKGAAEIGGCDYLVLSRIIEKVSHRSFGAYMKRTVFGPASMADTSVGTVAPSKSAKGYKVGAPTLPLHTQSYRVIYSSVADIYHLDRSFLVRKVLSMVSQRLLITPYVALPDYAAYLAYGTGVAKRDQFPNGGKSHFPFKTHQAVFQSTGGPDPNGFTLDNWFSPGDGTIAVYFSNDPGRFDDNIFVARSARLLWGR